MARNERTTCREVIEPLLSEAGWDWDEQLRIGPGRVNITGDNMYDESQAIVADYLLRYRGIPLAILEAKAESESAADGMQQASRYARRLTTRFSIASNGSEWIITDNETGVFETLERPPTPDEIISRLGVSIAWDRWGETFSAGYHVDQVTRKQVRPYQDMAIAKTLWQTALDHYALFGIDDLEQARTYGAPQFTELFGSFHSLTKQYGGTQLLKADLEAVKHHVYVPMPA